MVVHKYDGRGLQLEGSPENFSWVDRRMIDGAVAHGFISDQTVSFVEEQDSELFTSALSKVDFEIGEKSIPARNDIASQHRSSKDAPAGVVEELEIDCGGSTDQSFEGSQVGGQHPIKRSPPAKQNTGPGLRSSGERLR